MNYREIPTGATEIQTGLYWYRYSKVIAGNTYWFGELYSEEGYCFYEINQTENYYEDGTMKPADELMYATYMSCAYDTAAEINANIVSVPYEEGYEVVSVPNPPVEKE